MSQQDFDFYWTQRVVDILIKVAGVMVTSFATLSVARQAFIHIDPPWLYVIMGAALVLVEGAFINSWLAIDSQKHAPMPMKIAWALTLVVIYVALLILAIANGEGAAGWAFRFVLAVMIGRSIYEAGIYELLRRNRQEERDITTSYTVRRVARQLAKESAIAELYTEKNDEAYARDLHFEVERARIESEHETAMVEVKMFRERLLAGVHAKDTLSRKRLQAQIHREQLALAQSDSSETGDAPPALLQ
ncbi:MAG: hypothetical protein R2834_15440 [Rhodothermales bacterium]